MYRANAKQNQLDMRTEQLMPDTVVFNVSLCTNISHFTFDVRYIIECFPFSNLVLYDHVFTRHERISAMGELFYITSGSDA